MFQPASHLFPILDQSFTSHPIRPPNPPCFHLSSLFSHPSQASKPYTPDASKSITYQVQAGFSSAVSMPARQPKPSLYAQAHRIRPPRPQHNLYGSTNSCSNLCALNSSKPAQTIRRADYDTTCNDIIRDLTGQFPGIPEPVMLEDDLTEGYIPYPPHYCDSTSLRRLLKPYGTVHTDRFQTSPDGTRIGGYTFRLALHSGQTLPAEIICNGYTMHVKAKDAPKICSCKRHWAHGRGVPDEKGSDGQEIRGPPSVFGGTLCSHQR